MSLSSFRVKNEWRYWRVSVFIWQEKSCKDNFNDPNLGSRVSVRPLMIILVYHSIFLRGHLCSFYVYATIPFLRQHVISRRISLNDYSVHLHFAIHRIEILRSFKLIEASRFHCTKLSQCYHDIRCFMIRHLADQLSSIQVLSFTEKTFISIWSPKITTELLHLRSLVRWIAVVTFRIFLIRIIRCALSVEIRVGSRSFHRQIDLQLVDQTVLKLSLSTRRVFSRGFSSSTSSHNGLSMSLISSRSDDPNSSCWMYDSTVFVLRWIQYLVFVACKVASVRIMIYCFGDISISVMCYCVGQWTYPSRLKTVPDRLGNCNSSISSSVMSCHLSSLFRGVHRLLNDGTMYMNRFFFWQGWWGDLIVWSPRGQ